MPDTNKPSLTQSFTIRDVPKEYVQLFEWLELEGAFGGDKYQSRTELFLTLLYNAEVHNNLQLGDVETLEQARAATDQRLAYFRTFNPK